MKVVCESVSRPPLNFSLVHPRPTGGREILMENKGKFVTGIRSFLSRIYLARCRIIYAIVKKKNGGHDVRIFHCNKFVQFACLACDYEKSRR